MSVCVRARVCACCPLHCRSALKSLSLKLNQYWKETTRQDDRPQQDDRYGDTKAGVEGDVGARKLPFNQRNKQTNRYSSLKHYMFSDDPWNGKVIKPSLRLA